MIKRFLGKNGLQVSAIGFGCMGLDSAYRDANIGASSEISTIW